MKFFQSLFIALCALCVSLPVVAGDNFDHFKIGVGAGLNAGYTSSFNAGDLYQLDSYSGFFLGPQADLRLTRHLAIGTALFLQKNELTFFQEEDIVITSLQIPVNLSVALHRGDVLSLLVEAGPQFSYRASEKKVQLDNGTLTFADYTPSINLGVVAELGDVLRVGARVNLPTRNLADIKDTSTYSDSFRLSTLQITGAILF